MDQTKIENVYDVDSPKTKDQAEALLKQYYKEHRNEKDFPRRPALLSWKLNENRTFVLVDGASGRKLEFIVDQDQQAKAQEAESAEDAEEALIDAEAEAQDAEAKAAQARALADQAKANAKEAKKTKAKAEAVTEKPKNK